MERTGTGRNNRGGQSLVECALVLPLLILLIVNVVNFGAFFYAGISVANAARTGAQYFTTGGVTVSGITPPAVAAVQNLVTAELGSLPNKTSIQVCLSRSNVVAVSCNQGAIPAGAPPAADTPEGSPAVTYVIGAVDVAYTYQPVVPLWDLPGMNIHATIPPTTVHRQVRMRVLQ